MTDLQILEAYPNARKFTKENGTLWLSYPKRAMMGNVMANVTINPVTTLETFLLGTTIADHSNLDMNNDDNFYSVMNEIFSWITEISNPQKK